MSHMHDHNIQDKNFLKKIDFLESRQREQLVSPETLICQMPIQQDHTLLDVGAGSGFFTIPMAESTSGKVFALDPDKRMLAIIADKAKGRSLNNIELIQDPIENLSLQNSSIDFVMASLILHEVPSLSDALSKIIEVMKPGGHLLCLEYEKDDAVIEGPPMAIRVSSESLQNALTSIGFSIVETTKMSDAIYTVLAVKQGEN